MSRTEIPPRPSIVSDPAKKDIKWSNWQMKTSATRTYEALTLLAPHLPSQYQGLWECIEGDPEYIKLDWKGADWRCTPYNSPNGHMYVAARQQNYYPASTFTPDSWTVRYRKPDPNIATEYDRIQSWADSGGATFAPHLFIQGFWSQAGLVRVQATTLKAIHETMAVLTRYKLNERLKTINPYVGEPTQFLFIKCNDVRTYTDQPVWVLEPNKGAQDTLWVE